MVAFLPILGLTGSLLLALVLYPRLPKYYFKITSMAPRWYSDIGFRAKLGADVKLKNDNNINIDIYALSFDLFYPSLFSGDTLYPLGNVHDTRQQDLQDNGTSGGSGGSTIVPKQAKDTPMWQLKARKFFVTTDSVLMAPLGSVGVISRLIWDMIRQWGIVTVRSTGSIHIKANGQLPLTLNILCDNILDAWKLEMQGVHCDLDGGVPEIGWTNMTAALDKLRPKVDIRRQEEEKKEARKGAPKAIAA